MNFRAMTQRGNVANACRRSSGIELFAATCPRLSDLAVAELEDRTREATASGTTNWSSPTSGAYRGVYVVWNS